MRSPRGGLTAADGVLVPHVGLVIAYAYLWASQYAAGAIEGRKVRPCVVALVRTLADGTVIVWVAPITHRTPDTPDDAVELPPRVKRRLGLDTDRSWIIAAELNRFVWRSPDLHPTPSGGEAFGTLPECVVAEMRERMKGLWKRSRFEQVPRDG